MSVTVGSVWSQRDQQVEVIAVADDQKVWVEQVSTGDTWRLSSESLQKYWRPVIPAALFPQWQSVYPTHLGWLCTTREEAVRSNVPRVCVLRYELDANGDVRVTREDP